MNGPAEYQQSLDKLKGFIDEFQEVKMVTSTFEFLDEVSQYEDLTPTRRKEILQVKTPHVWKFLNRYEEQLQILINQLKEYYALTKGKEVKKVEDYLDRFIIHCDNELEPDKVKNRIKANYTDENLYDYVPFGSINIPAFKPGVWSEFKIGILDDEYLFEDYFGILYGLLDIISKVVALFKTGFKESTAKNEVKPDLQLSQNTEESSISLVEKYSTRLQDYISEEKWPAFISLCDKYCKIQIRKDIGEFIAIKKLGADSYRWQGFNGKPVESLALFITSLILHNYLNRQGVNYRFAKAFLKYFGLEDEYKPKWLSVLIGDNSAKAKRIFEL